MAEKIFLDYDQASLDEQYKGQGRIPNYESYIPRRHRQEWWAKFWAPIFKQGNRPRMDPMIRSQLIEYYYQHNRQLEKLVGHDLSQWDK